MGTYKYHIFHIESEQPHHYKKLKHEYDNIDMALHLFCRSNDLEPSANAEPVGPLEVSIEISYFESKKEAKQFIENFLIYLRSIIQVEFYPSINFEQEH